jgi:hypothetical protein
MLPDEDFPVGAVNAVVIDGHDFFAIVRTRFDRAGGVIPSLAQAEIPNSRTMASTPSELRQPSSRPDRLPTGGTHGCRSWYNIFRRTRLLIRSIESPSVRLVTRSFLI